MKVVITSGYFSPIRLPHIESFNLAKTLGDKLIVIVNNDAQVIKKNKLLFMNETDRAGIIKNIKSVDEVFLSIDNDETVCLSIRAIVSRYTNVRIKSDVEFIFAKGGDRFASNVPEYKICEKLGVKIVDGLGLKNGSSSDILNNYYNTRKILEEQNK